ncbi:MAG: hypothetical protein IH984_00845 [Planctomycetes bacterium]|nr:hypothetical protein [Planctomycetota bacterium]
MNNDLRFLRHMLAVIAYRGGKVLRHAPDGFGITRVREDTRSAVEILSHINDTLQWGLTAVQGKQEWQEQAHGEWPAQVDRFFDVLKRFDEALKSTDELPCSAERLIAGPLADSLTHIGQLSTLRKLAGSAVLGENYFVADIEIGKVGRDQAAPKRES